MLFPPSSLAELGQAAVNREDVIECLNQTVVSEISSWKTQGFEQIRHQYLASAFRLNETISVGKSADKKDYVEGIYKGINEHGHLILQTNEKQITFSSGDVFMAAQ
jgi:biotin-(acetyl-CoA carboxylase) ligase